MENNSHSFYANSFKTFDNSQIIFNNNPLKNKIKKNLKIFSNINTNLYYQKNNSASNIFLEKLSQTSLAKNSIEIKNMYNRLTPSCLRNNKKYGNFYIFGKRELAFNKSVKEGKLVFKYHQSIGIEKKPKNIIKIMNPNKINDSLYLTESISKSTKNKTTLPLIEKDKSINEENKSISINNKYENKNISFSRNSLHKNNISNNNNIDINSFNNIEDYIKNYNINNNEIKNKNKKSVIYLKKISLIKEKEKEDLEKKEITTHYSLFKKQEILEKSYGKNGLKDYINDFREILLDKYNLSIKKEKEKVVNENVENKLNKINDNLLDLELSSKLFLQEFYPKFNEYIKFFEKLREIERQKNLFYINKVYLLEKRINTIKNKISKYQIEKEYLMKEMLLQISIQEKNLNLPKYYTDILIKDFTYEQIKEKYGEDIEEKEYNNILQYKSSLDENEMDSIFEKIQQLENENIELINAFNKAHAIHLVYKKKRQKVKEEIENDSKKQLDKLILAKERQLNLFKLKFKNTEKDLNNLLKSKDYSPSDNSKLRHSKIYLKVELLLKNLDENLNYELDIDDKIRGKITEEKLIIQAIRRIEIIITMFLAEYKEEKINYPKKVKYYKNIFDKERKFKKAIEQKRNNFLKLERERKKIFDKYTKIIFLKNKKIYHIKPDKKVAVDVDLSKLKEKGDKIEQFLYDLYD